MQTTTRASRTSKIKRVLVNICAALIPCFPKRSREATELSRPDQAVGSVGLEPLHSNETSLPLICCSSTNALIHSEVTIEEVDIELPLGAELSQAQAPQIPSSIDHTILIREISGNYVFGCAVPPSPSLPVEYSATPSDHLVISDKTGCLIELQGTTFGESKSSSEMSFVERLQVSQNEEVSEVIPPEYVLGSPVEDAAHTPTSSSTSIKESDESDDELMARPAPVDWSIAQLSDFDLLEELGSGMFGTVFKARYIPTDQIVALKRMVPNSDVPYDKLIETADYDLRASFDCQRAGGRGVVKLFCWFGESGCVYIVMECAISDLDHVIRARSCNENCPLRKGLPMNEAKKYFAGLLEGIHTMHSASIAHRDLKPENLLVFSDGSVRIGDFGCATWVRYRRDDGSMILEDSRCGTYEYRAPEQHRVKRSRPYNLFANDMFAAGVILWNIAYGRNPSHDRSVKPWSGRIRATQLDKVEDPDLRDLVGRLMCPVEERLTLQEAQEHRWLRED
ncbi:hypothetical protein HDU93_005998 [Gonapodya sp. JEL0774]|nr:hypothetical protein HDU93_005998 [Gonapodya sp. JEL0774]